MGVKQEDHDALLAEVQRLEVELGNIRQDLQGVAGCKGKCEQLDALQETVSKTNNVISTLSAVKIFQTFSFHYISSHISVCLSLRYQPRCPLRCGRSCSFCSLAVVRQERSRERCLSL